MSGAVGFDAMPAEVQLLNCIMKSKLVHISLLPSVEHFTVKRNIPLNKKNFKKKLSI